MEDILDIMRRRHSVRRYKNVAVEKELADALRAEAETVNRESGLNVRLFVDEPEAFKAAKPHYGSFSGCRNYFVIEGPENMAKQAGYYGERLVLYAQRLGLNTCWVALTYERSKVTAEKGNEIYVVIALGYGENEGVQHRSKPYEKLIKAEGDVPEWFKRGAEGAMLAPTAINQQQFRIELLPDKSVRIKSLPGPCRYIDYGIVKYHFEAAAGKDNFKWAD